MGFDYVGGALDEIDVDNFAGGGGASTGIERATGRPITIAVNHSRAAIAMHAANHPHTRHECEDIWAVDPRTVCAGGCVSAPSSVIAWVDVEVAKVRASFAASRDVSEARECVRRLAGLERVRAKYAGGAA